MALGDSPSVSNRGDYYNIRFVFIIPRIDIKFILKAIHVKLFKMVMINILVWLQYVTGGLFVIPWHIAYCSMQ